jgi:hypothetical protein
MIISHIEALNRLNQLGFTVNNVYDLVNTKQKYTEKIHILIDLLKYDFTEIKIKEGIVRALGIKEASGLANNPLIQEYKKSVADKQKQYYCWAIGNTMCVIVKKDDIQDLIDIVENKSNGFSRQMFVMALGRIKSELVENVLIKLLNDSEVVLQAIYSLGKLKSAKAKPKLIALLNHKDKIVSKEAAKALKSIEKFNN